jgi:hypothetical protein
LSEIIQHTPTWVFILFFALLALGFKQSKPRVVRVSTVFILPAAMVIFSFFGMYSVFGMPLLALALWTVSLLLLAAIGLKLQSPALVTYSKTDQQLTIPGSWVPLCLMMAIFFTKYVVGVAVARDLPIVQQQIFLVVISSLYGAFSGVFLGRSLVMFQASRQAV